MMAVNFDHFQSVKFLLDHNANLEEKNDKGETALEIAVRKRRAPLVKLLVEKGARIDPSLNKEVQQALERARFDLVF